MPKLKSQDKAKRMLEKMGWRGQGTLKYIKNKIST